jgi:hypothetical protein
MLFCHQKHCSAVSAGGMIPLMGMIADLDARGHLTDKSVARLLLIDKRTLLRWLKRGLIDPPVVVVGKQGQRRWSENEVEQIINNMKRGGLGDSTADFQSEGRRGENNHRRYLGKVLRRQREAGLAD